MKTLRRVIGYIFLFLFSLQVSGQETDSVIGKLTRYIRATDQFSQYIPREKVYLHFDNTSYYQGDNIWFKCYVVTSELHESTQLSKTLYVELLNPGGEIIDKRVLKIENGQCHGDFTLGQLPFYSGFYEVRAYTKYMLNFGEDALFSRLLPVFDKPILPSGVSQVVVFNSNGEILCDRLIFNNKEKPLAIKAKTVKETYDPYEPVDMEFTVTDQEDNPVQSPFSLSVRDDMNEVKSDCNILTDLLLMSDIKGYVHNPSYYFEADVRFEIHAGARHREARPGSFLCPENTQTRRNCFFFPA